MLLTIHNEETDSLDLKIANEFIGYNTNCFGDLLTKSPTQTLLIGCGGLVPSCTQGIKSHKKTAREQEYDCINRPY